MPVPRLQMLVLTIRDDLHAYAIKDELEAHHNVACHIVETDSLAGSGGLTWSTAPAFCEATLPTVSAVATSQIKVADADLIWWRRANAVSRLPTTVSDDVARDVVTNDCRATMLGILLTEFHGAWVNDPEATRLAELKLVQLRAADRVGLRMPETLVSQDPTRIREFCHELNSGVVVKAVAGTHKSPLLTGPVTESMLQSDARLSLSPAIYQEYIPGELHLRAQCFGDCFYTASIRSPDLDWRLRLNRATIETYELPHRVQSQLLELMQALRLRMGIIDLKITADGEIVWLEVNPQGQFLFLEGLSDIKLTAVFAAFLVEEASRARAGMQVPRA